MQRTRRSDELLLTLVLLAVGKALLTRWLVLGFSDPFVAFALEAAAVVLVLCTVDLIPRRRSVALDLAAYIVLVCIMYANLLYASYFNQLADPSMLQMAGQVGSVGGSVLALVKPIHMLYLVDIPFLLVWGEDIAHFDPPQPGRSRLVTNVALVSLVVVAAQIFVVTRTPASADGFSVARSRGLGAYQLASMLRGEAVGTVLAAPQAETSSSSTSAGGRMQRRIDELRSASDGDRVEGVTHGMYKGHDVFLIQVEAFQALAFGASINGEEITPNINRMAADSWVCSNAHSETGAGNTSDAEFIANTSLLPMPGKAATVSYTDYEIPGMPRILSKQGYRTFTMHANTAEFWNRINLYPALGFDTYYDRTQIGEADKMYRGSSDEVFFEKAEQFISEEKAYDRPVYTQLVTLSSHAPFKYVPQNRMPVQLPDGWRDTAAGRWVGSLSYTDMAVGQFLDWLRETGLYDDSIVILYGDHKALETLELEGADLAIVEELIGREYTLVDRQRIPLIVHLPGQKSGGTIDSTVGQIDIAPTVADLLGVDMTEVPHLGRSIFVNSDPLVIMRSYYPGGSFLNARVAYLPGLQVVDGAALELTDGTPVAPTAEERLDLERASALSQLSDEWIRSLPKRADAGSAADAYIPVPDQRPKSE